MTPEQELRQRVYDDLGEIKSALNSIKQKVDLLKEEMITLKVRVAFFSSISATIVTIVAHKIIALVK